MKLTTDLIQELRRLSVLHDEPALAEAAERIEILDKCNSAMLRGLSRTKEDLEAVTAERDRMLADMHGVCRVCAYRDGTTCDSNIPDFGGDCEHWKWRGYK